jgi:uncharacterized membrane protein
MRRIDWILIGIILLVIALIIFLLFSKSTYTQTVDYSGKMILPFLY